MSGNGRMSICRRKLSCAEGGPVRGAAGAPPDTQDGIIKFPTAEAAVSWSRGQVVFLKGVA